MNLHLQPLDAVQREDLEQLVTDRVAEGTTLDFKQLPGDVTNDVFKTDFATDVAAMANTRGGLLLFGVKEKRVEGMKTNVADGPLGFAHPAPHKLKDQLLTVIRDRLEPQLWTCEGKVYEGFPAGCVLAIRVPRSVFGPHMVAREARFYARAEGDNYPMDWKQVHDAFVQNTSLFDQLKAWRLRRIREEILSNDCPVSLDRQRFVCLHVLSADFFSPSSTVDLLKVAQSANLFPLLGNRGWSPSYNFEGVVTTDGRAETGHQCYTQVFRGGAVEAVDTSYFHTIGDLSFLAIEALEKAVIAGLASFLRGLHEIAVHPPYFVLLTLIGANGYQIVPNGISHKTCSASPIRSAFLPLPPAVALSHEADSATILRPALDTLWQAGGWSGSHG